MTEPAAGHNSINSGHLRAFIERIEAQEAEKKARAEDIKEIYAEAKGTGYDVQIMRKIVSIRAKDANKVAKEDAVLDLYKQALGM